MVLPVLLGSLLVVWIGTAVLGGVLGGMATGVVVRRSGLRLEAAAQALVAAETRELARGARQHAAQLSAWVAVIVAVVLRLALPREGLDASILGIAIGVGVLLAVPLSVWWLRRDLAAFFRSSGRTTQAGSRPREASLSPGDEVPSRAAE